MTKAKEQIDDQVAPTLVEESVEEKSLAKPSDTMDFLLGTIYGQQEIKAAPFVVPRLAVYVPGKKGTEHGASHGFWVDHLDGQNFDVNLTEVRFHRMDLQVTGRIMWAFNDADGKKLQGDDYRDPWCGSSDGLSPRQGDRFNYVGKTYVDYRDHKPYTITDSCNGCPFQQWKAMYDENGTALMEDDGRGNLRSKNGMPPCSPTPKFPVYDVDKNRVLLFQTSGYIRNTHVLGSGPRGRFGAIMGINDYYNVDPTTKRPPVVDADGRLHALIMSVKMVDAGRGNGFQPVPVFRIDPNPMTDAELEALKEKQQLYIKDNGRAVISGHSYGMDFGGEDGYVPASSAAQTVLETPF